MFMLNFRIRGMEVSEIEDLFRDVSLKGNFQFFKIGILYLR